MKNKIKTMLNTLKEHNINLSMFVKIIDDKSAMILLAEKEIIDKDGNSLHIVTDAANLSNMYKEEYSDIIFPINPNYDKQAIENCAISRLKGIIILKVYNVLENNMESIRNVILVDSNKNILSNATSEQKETRCSICGSCFH